MPMIDVSAYKLELLSDIYNNAKIVEAIDSQQADVINAEPDTLMYKNLFPYKAMVDMGIMSSPDYWRGITSVRWLNELMGRTIPFLDSWSPPTTKAFPRTSGRNKASI